MANGKSVTIPKNKLIEAKKLRDELSSLIETAEILNNKKLFNSIKKSEQDLKKGKLTKVKSKKDLDDFFNG